MVAREVLSFAIGGSAFLLFFVASFRQVLKDPALKPILAASLVTALWCYLCVGPLPDKLSRELSIIITELLRNGLWLVVFLRILNAAGRGKYLLNIASHSPWLAGLCYALYQFSTTPEGLPPQIIDRNFLWIFISVNIVGLVLTEQVYRNTVQEYLYAMRFIYIGIAGLFTFDLYFYAHALLFEKIETDLWSSRGAVCAIVAGLLSIGIFRLSHEQLKFKISRHLVFYSTSLIVTGGFLFVMSVGGYYVRLHSGTWGIFFQSIIVFATATFTALLMSSKRTRAHIKVLMNKHLFTYHYDYREEWLRLTQTLTSTDSQNIQILSLKSMAQIFDTDGGALWLNYDNKVYVQAAEIGLRQLKGKEVPIESTLHTYLLETRRIIVVEEYQNFPERYPKLSLPGWLQSQDLWLIVPLILHDSPLGFITLRTPHIKRHLSWEDFDLLKTAGLQIASFLAAEQSSRALSESRQFDAYNRLTAFIMHDLKNLIAQQSLVVKNATKHKDNPAFVEDAIKTIENSVARMSRLLDQLKQGEQDTHESTIILQELLRDAVRKCNNREPRPSLHILDEDLYVTTSSEQLSMIFGHVIRNAQDATDSSGFIDVTLSKKDGCAMIEVEDNGIGMNQRFIRERLFRPFDTTKSSKGMGIGAYQTREFIRQAGGDVDISSEEGKGTTFCISLPLTVVKAASKTA